MEHVQAKLQKTQVKSLKVVSQADWLVARKHCSPRKKNLRASEMRSSRTARVTLGQVESSMSLTVLQENSRSRNFSMAAASFSSNFHDGTRQKQQCVGCSLEVDHLKASSIISKTMTSLTLP